MNTTTGRRRNILADAIESLGSTAAAAPELAEEQSEALVPADPVGRSAAPAFLERRGAAFDEIARAVKRPTIKIKPSECSIWPGNARDYAALTYERCVSLIDSIREEGANREAVVIRRTQKSDRPFELIVGTRRHFSISWLHANNHTEIELVARIETLDDEGAFRLADLENREREDVTDLERARNYREAIDSYYNGVRTQMAERLAIPKQNLHNLLQLAELPDEVVAAFAEPADVKVRHGMRLSPLLKDAERRDPILAAANDIATEQSNLRDAGSPKIEGSRVCERLVAAATAPRTMVSPTRTKAVVMAASGREVGQILSDTKTKGMTLSINPKGGSSVDEILEALRPIIENARFNR
ncbi:MAG TPA: ParB/RepB/Spo0J family partition protein [Sphingobium sp.]|uniref:ParB/RepB/Spo0J family partition protein n=1 Tax=Sphingobium sp. TaxID=1912891 RepID=UPI002ED5CB28